MKIKKKCFKLYSTKVVLNTNHSLTHLHSNKTGNIIIWLQKLLDYNPQIQSIYFKINNK